MRRKSVGTFLFLCLPALLTGLLMYLYGVDVPYGDQWDGTAPLFEKMESGTLGVADFYALHNEHRIFFPRLLDFNLARLTHWNVRAELLVIWLLLGVSSFNLWRLARVTGWGESRALVGLLFAANVLLFTPLQWENLLWGFQIGFLLPIAASTAALWVARGVRYPLNFIGTGALCLVCTFSVASGFVTWLLTLPILLWPNAKASLRLRKIPWALWLATAIASTGFYFRGYVKPAHHPSPLELLKHPLEAIRFACAYLGNPFASGTAFDSAVVAQFAGGGLVIALLCCVVFVWRERRDAGFVTCVLPWLMLCGIALVNCALTTAGRLGFGLPSAMVSRYVSFAIMLPIGLLFIVAVLVQHTNARRGERRSSARTVVALAATATLFAVLLIFATLNSLESWKRFQHYRLTGKALVALINIVDEPQSLARHVHAIVPPLKPMANTLNRLGYLRPGLVRSNRIREIAYQTAGGPVAQGNLDKFGEAGDGTFVAAGWAILPDKGRPADAVLLTCEDENGERIIFALSEVGMPRPDVSIQLQDPAYLRSGWAKNFPAPAMGSHSHAVTAWAFDAEENRAFPISGAARLGN